MVIMVAGTLTRDAQVLRRALGTDGDEVQVNLSRETAEWLANVVEAKAEGKDVLITRRLEEVTPAQASAMMGVSRPHLRKLMERGLVPYRKVGSHHRIPVAAMEAYANAERTRREAALDRLAELQNELGLVE
jgi:excisionase family DNA binding protein